MEDFFALAVSFLRIRLLVEISGVFGLFLIVFFIFLPFCGSGIEFIRLIFESQGKIKKSKGKKEFHFFPPDDDFCLRNF